jgi:hypothetical protein
MTYRYRLIVSGRPWGKPFASSHEVRAALQQYFADHPQDRPGRVLVERFRPDTDDQRQGVYPARAFLENAPNPDPDEAFWHGLVRDLLNLRLANRRFFLWLHVERGNGDSELADDFFLKAVYTWLSHVAPSEQADLPEPLGQNTPNGGAYWVQGKEFWWDAGGLAVHLTAIPRRAEVRDEPAGEVVGNPLPAFAYYMKE